MIRKLAATYSVIAYDQRQMGAAVQSHFFGVGSVVPWARAGVGVVCTQSIVNVDAGPQILALLELGATAHDALSMVVAADAERDYRQIAVIGATGSIAAHTGSKAIAHAGHVATAMGSFQANMMANPGVPEAMEAAFAAADGPLCDRLTAALGAAEDAGGDIRGRQSAAVVVVARQHATDARSRTIVDLRVEDHPEPLQELERLLTLHRAYAAAELGDQAMAAGNYEAAARHYRAATTLAPGNGELQFWDGLARAAQGDLAGAGQILHAMFARDPNWRELLLRLEPTGVFAFSDAVWQQLKEA